jgi:tRNA threonylcarbamoyladenosine biosynthesis protein TsaB
MALILCIETATKSCSIALAREGQLLACKEAVSQEYSHSEQLTVFIEDLLQEQHLTVQDLNAIAISSGPGSYTGLRIGVSTAKGLCYSLDIPLISISTLEAMAQLMTEKHSDKTLCPMIDARRMEVYCALFDQDEQTEIEAKVIDATSFQKELQQKPILFFGDGADKCQEVLTHANAHFELEIYPSARGMIALANNKFANKQFEDVAYYVPFYLKEFVAGVKK